jgi:hypothetical protein
MATGSKSSVIAGPAEPLRLRLAAGHRTSFGRPEQGMYVYSPSEAVAYGIGALHLAPGQGSIPFDALMAHGDWPRAAIFNIEVNERYFADEAGASIAETRRLAAAASAETRS